MGILEPAKRTLNMIIFKILRAAANTTLKMFVGLGYFSYKHRFI